MGFMIKVLLYLIVAAATFILKIALLYFAIAIVLYAIYWAFFESSFGLYLVSGLMFIVIAKTIFNSEKRSGSK